VLSRPLSQKVQSLISEIKELVPKHAYNSIQSTKLSSQLNLMNTVMGMFNLHKTTIFIERDFQTTTSNYVRE